jgi:hypothetical protein
MLKIKTHLQKFKRKPTILRKHKKAQAENYRKRGKKRKLKFLLLPNPLPVVGVDNLGSFTLARSSVGHPLQRIDPGALGAGAQAHRQYLHCPHQVEPRWFGWM